MKGACGPGAHLELNRDMGWLFWLMLAVIVVAFAAVTGIKPKEGRHVARTQLMGVARVVLVLLALVLIYMGYQANSGG